MAFTQVHGSPSLTAALVLPEGPVAIQGQELGGTYYEKAGPVVEKQVARGGYRLAAWLDLIADTYQGKTTTLGGGGLGLDEL